MCVCVCVFEHFNCNAAMKVGGWTLNGIRTVFPRTLTAFRTATSHTNNSMLHRRICFIFAPLKSLILELQNRAIFIAVCSIYERLFNCKAWRAAKAANRMAWRSALTLTLKKIFFLKIPRAPLVENKNHYFERRRRKIEKANKEGLLMLYSHVKPKTKREEVRSIIPEVTK